MHEGFYTTVAQTLPVLLLALLWESPYLDRLRQERRPGRGGPGSRGFFWTKPRVRTLILSASAWVVVALLVDVFALAGAVPDSAGLRVVILLGLVLITGMLFFRIWVDVVAATAEPPASGESPVIDAGSQ